MGARFKDGCGVMELSFIKIKILDLHEQKGFTS